ncbi:hypothetical protein A1O7_04598 [Cladophialophora yegresii CBS 114405]|uniref:Enoyl reductase (ER) domain-containing protein n=1 Tax=Cladophialophora yegresii CBS 114405 TaxID=1182544 RepID=W9W625_9EURO|nr:uncharacterized protein A1O7_04598 [Cladophialophora yegresii CBS 114405]EXJ60445.1 hypothetical protein A1O7_04598 [Cladophialophora yegresii CBS 114405]
MATHPAVVTVGPGLPLEILQVPTPTPTGNEIRVRALWTASTPLDLHQADGGLLVQHPQLLGDSVAGRVVEVGPHATKYNPGDLVFGFTWRSQREKAHQEYVVAPEFLFGKLPSNGITMQQAVTLPNNFVTVWHTLTKEFGFDLPWPRPEGYVPLAQARDADAWILIWGGSSSVGQFALQILKYYGYTRVITTASKAHHEKLRRYGAAKCFDYRDPNAEENIISSMGSEPTTATDATTTDNSDDTANIYILDCIGSLEGSVLPISRIVSRIVRTTPRCARVKVAILLPIIVVEPSPGVRPIYEMDVLNVADWPVGVEATGVRTHFYLDNAFLRNKLQSEIMPAVLEGGIVEPNEQVIVEGATMLERAEKALGMLREKKVSGKRVVWRVADSDRDEA